MRTEQRRASRLGSGHRASGGQWPDRLASYPGNIEPGDLDALGAHFSEEQIIELVMVIATAGWTNRVNDGLQTPLP